ncbi:MAG TPA: hypothetical protein PK760_16110 [Flavobacteriales bacterium]|nr:hypothetical protein [Flavobacteriales bacterium]
MQAVALAQAPITGTVFGSGDAARAPELGVVVKWLGTNIVTVTDSVGRFSLAPPPEWPASLVLTRVDVENDTVPIVSPPEGELVFHVKEFKSLGAVDVVERTQSTRLDTRSINASEGLGRKELKRAACCDLSESFETNATVDVSFSDAVLRSSWTTSRTWAS